MSSVQQQQQEVELLEEQQSRIKSSIQRQLNEEGDVFLDLSSERCSDVAVCVAVGELRNNTDVKGLVFFGNSIGNQGCKQLAELIQINKSLQMISFCNSNINDDGIQIIAKALVQNTSLKSLLLRRNSIGNEGCKSLAKVVEVNKSLKNLRLYRNDVDVEGANVLADVLQNNNASITFLDLKYNNNLDKGEGKKAVNKINFFTHLNRLGRPDVFEASKNYNIIRDDFFNKVIQLCTNAKAVTIHPTYYLSCIFYCLQLRPDIICSHDNNNNNDDTSNIHDDDDDSYINNNSTRHYPNNNNNNNIQQITTHDVGNNTMDTNNNTNSINRDDDGTEERPNKRQKTL